MKRRNFQLLVLLTLILVLIIFFISSFYYSIPEKGPTAEEIKMEIERANYCETKSDCVQVETKCPFGCYVFVNENEAERISLLINSYETNCAYSCIAIDGYGCVENKCKTHPDLSQ